MNVNFVKKKLFIVKKHAIRKLFIVNNFNEMFFIKYFNLKYYII